MWNMEGARTSFGLGDLGQGSLKKCCLNRDPKDEQELASQKGAGNRVLGEGCWLCEDCKERVRGAQ